MKRRRFLQVSLTVASVAATNAFIFPAKLFGGQGHTSADVVYDARHVNTEDLEFLLNIKCDSRFPISDTESLTKVWYNHLYHNWRDARQVTVGLTEEPEFFVLKTLARDQGYCVTQEDKIGQLIAWQLAPISLR